MLGIAGLAAVFAWKKRARTTDEDDTDFENMAPETDSATDDADAETIAHYRSALEKAASGSADDM